MQPLFEGAAFVAARAGVPIVPVGIGGSEWAMPKGKKRILPVKVVMVVGAPHRRRPTAARAAGSPGGWWPSCPSGCTRELQALFDEALKASPGGAVIGGPPNFVRRA